VAGLIAEGEVKAGVRKRQARTTKDTRFIILIFVIAKGKYINLVPCTFEGTFIQVHIICDAANIRFICVHHHSNAHKAIVQLQGLAVKTSGLFCGPCHNGRICAEGVNLVKLILRTKEYEVKAGMTLLSALHKINVLPESVIATREGEMILEDEILKDGDVVKLIAVISGG
jgi:sulfur carrier protein